VLDALHPAPTIPLEHGDAFTLLVAVVLSAQTTDKKVNQVTPALFAMAPTPQAMRACSEASIRACIREVGLAPQKARALRGLAAQLCDRHDAQVPEDFDALLALPGVGRKTANVVMSQAFGHPAFPVDTHILRLANRWGLSRASTADGVEVDLCRIFARDTWNKLHLQIIYFGRSHCPALFHDLTACPICAWAATRARIAQEIAANRALRLRRR
jgi:endonuclease-3